MPTAMHDGAHHGWLNTPPLGINAEWARGRSRGLRHASGITAKGVSGPRLASITHERGLLDEHHAQNGSSPAAASISAPDAVACFRTRNSASNSASRVFDWTSRRDSSSGTVGCQITYLRLVSCGLCEMEQELRVLDLRHAV